NLCAIGGAHDIQDGDGIESPTGQVIFAESYQNLGHPRWRLYLHFASTGNACENSSNLGRLPVKFIEIVSENVDNDCGSVAGQGLVDSFSQEAIGREDRARNLSEHLPNAVLCRPQLGGVDRLHIYIYLALV